MSGYYPDGVSGNEWQIAGRSMSEGEDERTVNCPNENCDLFDEPQDLMCYIESDGETEYIWFTCNECGTEEQTEAEAEIEEDDPDRYRD